VLPYDPVVSPARVRILGGVLALVALVAGVVVATRDDGGTEDASELDTVDDSTTTTRRSTTTSTRPTRRSTTSTSGGSGSTSTSEPSGGGPPGTASSGTTSPPSPPTTGAPPDPFASARIRLTRVASLDFPIAMAVRPTDGSLWIALKGGFVCRLSGSACTLNQRVATPSTGSEQGLLGIAFSPSGSRFYASYTNGAGDTRVDEFPVRADGTAEVSQRRNIVAVDQPESNHNGGDITFGPDGRLYLALGDGGGAGDQHGPTGNGQNPNTDLGKILRVDPASKSIQRWISGVRNPWRISFDRATGDLWVADVGQAMWEEVTYLRVGAQQGRNLGWRCYEGTHVYSGCTPAGGHTGPIYEYRHGAACSITGGYVYRGSKIPALVGAYLFSDYCDGQIRGLTISGGRVRTVRALGPNPGNVVSFGQAGNGDLFVMTPSALYRIDPA
jgi:glucose/arabinose dehydrogenase